MTVDYYRAIVDLWRLFRKFYGQYHHSDFEDKLWSDGHKYLERYAPDGTGLPYQWCRWTMDFLFREYLNSKK